MSTEKMREEFELAIVKMHVDTGLPFDDAKSFLETGSRGYNSIYTKAAWWAWQASRESLVIELPPIWEESPNTALGQACAQIRTADIQAIEAAGLKVTP